MKNRNYSELSKLKTFDERFEYLKLSNAVGLSTFGFDRFINQLFYRSSEWKRVRREVIVRDNACDLGILDRQINNMIFIHHINPITIEEFKSGSRLLLDLENLICCSANTHNAIHFGNKDSLNTLPIKREKGDTLLW
jgi:hypothetical protein